jgi:hypothetical protein
MKLKKVPRSRAKTADGLVGDVIRAVLDEPRRVNMGEVACERLPDDGGPACGTVGCFAGWVCLLAGMRREDVGDTYRAERILGLNVNYYTVGRSGGEHVFNSGHGDRCWWLRPGGAAYARAVAARIQKFRRINRKQLRACRLPHTKDGHVDGYSKLFDL